MRFNVRRSHGCHSQGPNTARETSFVQVFGRDLREARQACKRYRVHGEPHEIEKAWEVYYGVRSPYFFSVLILTRLGPSGIQED